MHNRVKCLFVHKRDAIVGAYSTVTVQSASVMKAGLPLGFSTTDATVPGNLMKETNKLLIKNRMDIGCFCTWAQICQLSGPTKYAI